MTEATTEPVRRPHAFSVRTRITATVATLTALSLLLVGVLLHALGVAAMHEDAAHAIDQEFEEFRTLHDDGTDPQTGRPFTVEGVLHRFLERNVPDDEEVLVTYLAGEPRNISAGRSLTAQLEHERLLSAPEYREAALKVLDDGGTEPFDLPRYGEVWVSALPVRARGSTGGGNALVVLTLFEGDRAELTTTLELFALAALASLLLVIGLAWIQAGRLLAPIRVLRSTAQEISTTDLSRRIPETGNDDVTELTRTINRMLARLEEGFEAQRRFLDDAGHELRTPLTVMTGHLELTDASDPAEVEAARTLLLDETDRMSRLVEDLILLAKARRPDFLRPGPVDVDGLTHDVFTKMRVLGDRDWDLARVATGTAHLDAHRVTQALLQLADNAVKHTAPGDRITFSSTRDGKEVRFRVSDTGDGVPVADRERIFDRFARSRVRRGDEGFGLGLSIVAAIAASHGGRVSLEDSAKTTFVLTIPTEEDAWGTS